LYWSAIATSLTKLSTCCAASPVEIAARAPGRASAGGEIDATFYVLKALSWTGIVWDLKSPPASVIRNEQRLGTKVIEKAAADLAATFDVETISSGFSRALASTPSLAPLRESLSSAQHRAADLLASVHMPPLPTKEEVCARASKLFARTTSLDEIVERAHRKLLDEVSRRLLKMSAV
jgi:stearoyl-CoA desaturase (Delta-9 desaturase)